MHVSLGVDKGLDVPAKNSETDIHSCCMACAVLVQRGSENCQAKLSTRKQSFSTRKQVASIEIRAFKTILPQVPKIQGSACEASQIDLTYQKLTIVRTIIFG